ncbi:hypothetical protein ABGB17_19145 [Sphaerisporangium sp. B11E5]
MIGAGGGEPAGHFGRGERFEVVAEYRGGFVDGARQLPCFWG